MPRTEPRFAIGSTVQRTNQPEAVGVVRDRRWDEASEAWNYSVQFGAQLKGVPEEGLREFTAVLGPWDALTSLSFSSDEHFRFVLTYHRLRRPPARIAHSFTSSRTLFFPHQFKPLLKFLDHPGKRILIADDVGLGKTIEAGYILRELEAHQDVERVLVLVPSRLTRKWKRELKDRFEEHFDVVPGKQLIELADRLRKGSEPEPFRWIVSYESARKKEVRLALEDTQPAIDVLIADEAHRMRNPRALQHRLGATLSRCADANIFLTATPVQNKLEDLWHLLRLLSPEEFLDFSLFESQMEGNRFVIAAQRALAQAPPGCEAAARHLESFLRSTAGERLRRTELVRALQTGLAAPEPTRRDVVELQGQLGRLSIVGDIVSRTRKVEALPNKAVRDAKWQSIRLTPQERAFYDSVQTLCLASGLSRGSWGSEMALIMAYRVTASCIPAAMGYFREKLTDASSLGLALDQQLEEGESMGEAGESGPTEKADSLLAMQGFRDKLREAVDLWARATPDDSKLAGLVELLQGIWAEDERGSRPRRKVVVFSFFRRTLEYLRDMLSRQGLDVRMIHGLVPPEDRERAIDDFLDGAPLVLLASEVGSEGIDLQKASVVVNYDLPWNPMVVEQRIGRVDRIGQEAPRIIIRNLVVTDSVEERIVARLLDKIGVFRDSIGELEPIIGDRIQSLMAQYLREELTEAELDERVRQEEEAIDRRLREARDVLGRVDGLLAADQELIDEIAALTGERQIPSEDELFAFLNVFLARRVPGCQLPEAALRSAVQADLRGRLADELMSSSRDPETAAFARRVASSPVFLTLSREAGYRHPRAEVLRLGHPLVRFAVDDVTKEFARQGSAAAFCLRLTQSDKLSAGEYMFAASFVEIHANRPVTRLAVAVTQLGGHEVAIEPEAGVQILLEALERGKSATPPPGAGTEMLQAAKESLQHTIGLLINDWEARERSVDTVRREQQTIALRATADLRVRRAEARLRTLQANGAAAFAQRMAEKRIEKAQKELREIASRPQERSWPRAESEDVAVGILLVGAPDQGQDGR